MKSNIRKLRIEKNDLTQNELADALGLSQQVISRMEHDRDKILVKNLIAMADYFQVSTDEILGYQPKKQNDEKQLKDSGGLKPVRETEDVRQAAVYDLLISVKRCLEECGI